jgi:immunity protein 50 of polymorphic toxin system
MGELVHSILGAQQLFDWFGYWPSFHDAEVLSIELNRTGTSKLRVHTFRMTKEVSPKGFYVCDKHCIVTFVLGEIIDTEIAHFMDGNILQGIEFSHEEDAFVITFSASYGFEGTVKTKKLAIEFAPGIPADSRYNETE